jgi:hypothetical protein
MSRRWNGRSGLSLLFLAFALALTPALAGAASLTPSPSAEGAVAVAVTDLGANYAGDCAGMLAPDDLGRVCSKLIGQQGNVRAYLVGPAFSEFTAWVFVEQVSTGWYPLNTAPYSDSTAVIPWPPLPAG